MAIFRILGENKSVFEEGENFRRNIRSDEHYTPEQIQELKPLMVHRFKCLDDDGVTYFWGVCSDNSSFAPLDCVGVAYGCTEIQYKNPKTGLYETL